MAPLAPPGSGTTGYDKAVGKSENLGVPVSFGGHDLLPLVEIGLTDLPKSGGATPPAHLGTPPLYDHVSRGSTLSKASWPKRKVKAQIGGTLGTLNSKVRGSNLITGSMYLFIRWSFVWFGAEPQRA